MMDKQKGNAKEGKDKKEEKRTWKHIAYGVGDYIVKREEVLELTEEMESMEKEADSLDAMVPHIKDNLMFKEGSEQSTTDLNLLWKFGDRLENLNRYRDLLRKIESKEISKEERRDIVELQKKEEAAGSDKKQWLLYKIDNEIARLTGSILDEIIRIRAERDSKKMQISEMLNTCTALKEKLKCWMLMYDAKEVIVTQHEDLIALSKMNEWEEKRVNAVLWGTSPGATLLKNMQSLQQYLQVQVEKKVVKDNTTSNKEIMEKQKVKGKKEKEEKGTWKEIAYGVGNYIIKRAGVLDMIEEMDSLEKEVGSLYAMLREIRDKCMSSQEGSERSTAVLNLLGNLDGRFDNLNRYNDLLKKRKSRKISKEERDEASRVIVELQKKEGAAELGKRKWLKKKIKEEIDGLTEPILAEIKRIEAKIASKRVQKDETLKNCAALNAKLVGWMKRFRGEVIVTENEDLLALAKLKAWTGNEVEAVWGTSPRTTLSQNMIALAERLNLQVEKKVKDNGSCKKQ